MTATDYPAVITFKLPPDDELRPRILAAAADNGLTVTFLTDDVFTVTVETPDEAYELGRDAAKLKWTIRL